MTGPTTAPHRPSIWWRLLVPIAGLAVIAVGTVWLEGLRPQVDPSGRKVEGLPELAVEGERTCRRGTGDGRAAEIRQDVPPGGRITSAQAYGCPGAFDGLRVRFAGEVVGELIPRRGGAWAQINDDAYALDVGPLVAHSERRGFNSGIAVWLPDGLHERVDGVGRYARRGSVVLIDGVFHRSDPEDGGGVTIRADDLQVLADPLEVETPLHRPQAITAAVLAVAALLTIGWNRARRA